MSLQACPLIMLLALAGCTRHSAVDRPTGKVVAVADGDTLTLLMDGNVQVRGRRLGRPRA